MATRISWTKPQPGSTIPLYQETLEMREAGMTLREIAAELEKRHNIQVEKDAVNKVLARYRDGGPTKESADKLSWAEPMEGSDRPLWEEAKAIKEAGLTWKETAEELQTRYGISVLPGTASGMVLYYSKAGKGERAKGKGERAKGEGQRAVKEDEQDQHDEAQRHRMAEGLSGTVVPAGIALVIPRGIVLRYRNQGIDLQVVADNEDDFRIKRAAIENLLAMAENG